MPLFLNLPLKYAPLHITHPRVLALPPPPPKPTTQNQMTALLALASTSTNICTSKNICSNSQEEEKIRQLKITIRNLTKKHTLQER